MNEILATAGDFIMDLLHIVLSPEYGAEALKVGAVYLLFRKDIKSLGEKISVMGMEFTKQISGILSAIGITNKRVDALEKHLGLSTNPKGVEGEQHE